MAAEELPRDTSYRLRDTDYAIMAQIYNEGHRLRSRSPRSGHRDRVLAQRWRSWEDTGRSGPEPDTHPRDQGRIVIVVWNTLLEFNLFVSASRLVFPTVCDCVDADRAHASDGVQVDLRARQQEIRLAPGRYRTRRWGRWPVARGT